MSEGYSSLPQKFADAIQESWILIVEREGEEFPLSTEYSSLAVANRSRDHYVRQGLRAFVERHETHVGEEILY